MTLETIATWLAENPEWYGPIRALWALLVAHVISYIWMSLFVIYMNRGEPRDKWLWERNAVRHVCAWPLYLATWPLRALWRLWRGRREARCQKEHNEACEIVRKLWREGRKENAKQYALLGIDQPYGSNLLRSLEREDANPETRKSRGVHDWPEAGPVPYGGSKPDESKRPVTRDELDKLRDFMFGHISGLTKRVEGLEARVGSELGDMLVALEAKEGLDLRVQMHDSRVAGFGSGYWGINTTSAGRSFGNFTASGFAKMSSNNNLEVLGPQDFTATPPASEPEVRVYKDPIGIVFVCAGGVEVALRTPGSAYWVKPSVPWAVERFGDNPYFTELHGPGKDAIVAEWRAWREGQ